MRCEALIPNVEELRRLVFVALKTTMNGFEADGKIKKAVGGLMKRSCFAAVIIFVVVFWSAGSKSQKPDSNAHESMRQEKCLTSVTQLLAYVIRGVAFIDGVMKKAA